jgi:DNA-binding NtrC family response regulator
MQKRPELGEKNLPHKGSVAIEFEGMLGISLPMLEVFQRIMEAASTDISVLITGETGTGKELVAAAIHKRSKRKDKPYIAVNTGAMTSELIATELFGHEKGAYTGALEKNLGRFEQADGGTIFLDEISTMDEKTQVSLLRVLEEKTFRRVGGEKDIHVDVRVIAATNENLEEAVKQRRFREDLYYRLDVFRINLPPLRERPPAAITLLTNKFVSGFSAIYGKQVRKVSPETLRCLRRYSWPGNVRELKNVVQRAVLIAKREELTPDLIPARIREAAGSSTGTDSQLLPIHVGMTLETVEKEFIRMTLAATGGNKKEAASILGISRRALYNKLKKYNLFFRNLSLSIVSSCFSAI